MQSSNDRSNLSWPGNKKKAVTFSFDDGVIQDTRLIELLNQYGLKCTFNLNSGLVGHADFLIREGHRINHYKIQPQDVKMHYAGHEVAAHTLTHPNLTGLDDAQIVRQVEQDRLNLSELVGYEVVGMAYPGGGTNHDARVARIIRERTGVRYCRTITNTDSFEPQDDLFCLRPNACCMEWSRMTAMAERFLALETRTPQIFYVWGHAFEMDYSSECWSRLEAFFQLISGKEGVFYGTNRQVLLDGLKPEK